mgnify:CR=1 FL=1
MTKKDYILIANAIAAARLHSDKSVNAQAFAHGVQAVAYDLANALAGNNARFDRDVFMHVALGDDAP